MRARFRVMIFILPVVFGAMAITRPSIANPPLNQSTSKPASKSADRLTEPAAMAKWLVERMAAGEFDAAVESFDKTMRKHLPADKLSKVWGDLQRSAGDFQSVGEPIVKPAGKLTVVVLPGTWKKARLDIQIALNADGSVSGLFFKPPTSSAAWQRPAYADPDKFNETDITVGSKPYKLDGKVCVPRGKGPHPGVVLIQGSGPHDKDETIGPNKPFRDLAWGLASRGIAVIRYDKRTLTYGEKVMAEGTTARNEVIDDALLALKILRKRPEVDAKATFIIGHSLGGCLAPVIAKADGELAGMVILSGTLRDLDIVVIDQLEYMAKLPGPQQEETKKGLPEIRADFEAMRAGKKKDSDLIMNAPVSYWRDINAQLGETGTKALQEFSGRVLILTGGRDYQIGRVDFDKWRSAAGDRRNVTFRWLPQMNHLYFAGTGPASPEDYEKPGHVDASVIEGLASWIKAGDLPETSEASTTKPVK